MSDRDKIERRYVVFVDYGLDGWKIYGQTDAFAHAVAMRDEAMGNGNSRVSIFRPVELEILEKPFSRE